MLTASLGVSAKDGGESLVLLGKRICDKGMSWQPEQGISFHSNHGYLPALPFSSLC